MAGASEVVGFCTRVPFCVQYEQQPGTRVPKEWFTIEAPNSTLARAFYYMCDGHVQETDAEGSSYVLTLYHGRFKAEAMSPLRRALVMKLQTETIETITLEMLSEAFPEMHRYLWEQALPTEKRTDGLTAILDEEDALAEAMGCTSIA